MRAAHSTTTTRPSRRRDQLRERDPVREPERVHGVRRDALRLLELVAVDRRRVDVDPADAEADARRAQPVGERQRDRLAVRARSRSRSSRCRRRTPRGSPRRSATPSAPRAGARRSSSSDSTRKTPRWPPESAGLSTAGKPTSSAARRVSAIDRTRGEARLRHARVGEPRAHRDLVRHQVRRLDADPGQPARLGDRGDDRDGAVGADGQHAVELEPRRRLEHRGRVGEVDDLRDVRLCEAERVGLRSTAATRRPSSFARRIARRWWRPGADEEDGFTADGCYFGASADRRSSIVPSTSIGAAKRAACCTASPSKTTPRNRPTVSSGRSLRIRPAAWSSV